MPKRLAPFLALTLLLPEAHAQPPVEGEPPRTGVPPRAPPPPPPDEIDLSTVPDQGPVVSLPEMLRLADTQSYDLAAARERIVQAEAAVRRAWAGLTPDATITGTYTRHDEDIPIRFERTTIFFQKLNEFGANLTVDLPIFVMPAYLGITSAKEAAEAADADIENVRNEILFSIAQAYYRAISAKRVIALSQAQLDATREQERVAQARFEVGQTPKVDFLRAGVERAQAEQDLRRATNAYDTTRLVLQALVGVPVPFQVEPPPPVQLPPLGPDETVQVALEQRGDLIASRKLENVARRDVSAAWWQFAPVITAQGVYRWFTVGQFNQDADLWFVQLAASWSIYNGERYANLDDARSRLREAAARRESLSRTVVQQVRTAELDLESARASLLKAQEQRRLARENAELVRAQYEAGVGTYLDIIDANTEVFRAGVSVVAEESSVEVAALQLRKAMGRFALAGERPAGR